MPVNIGTYENIRKKLDSLGITLVAVSKTKAVEEIYTLYELGQRDFGENYVQELLGKQELLPKDIRWHFIGHLQSNKVKYIAPFVHLIHGVDSLGLLGEVAKQGKKIERRIDCLLQVHIAEEETKFGFDEKEILSGEKTLFGTSEFVRVRGFMGMATATENRELVRKEFTLLKNVFENFRMTSIPEDDFNILSMGMSGDYDLAIETGSTMVRIGSLLFGNRTLRL